MASIVLQIVVGLVNRMLSNRWHEYPQKLEMLFIFDGNVLRLQNEILKHL